uniref:Uncharacterized protein n=1 Tax=Manihot esculenta TaxID=3983 RepID=A0A2C9ULE1_MANES
MEALYPASEYYPPRDVFSFKEPNYGRLNVGFLLGGGSTLAILIVWGIWTLFKRFNVSVGCSCSISNSHNVPDIELQL